MAYTGFLQPWAAEPCLKWGARMQSGVPPAEAAGSGKGRTKKIAYAEVLALREKRREERRDRPKSAYKGVSWDKKRSLWHVQLWTGSTVSLPT